MRELLLARVSGIKCRRSATGSISETRQVQNKGLREPLERSYHYQHIVTQQRMRLRQRAGFD